MLYSTEKPEQELVPMTEEQEEDPSEFQALPEISTRVRTVPVMVKKRVTDIYI